MATAISSQDLDLAYCDREPIHHIGRIQSFGWLLAFSSDWIITHASANCRILTGAEALDMIGRPASEYIDANALHDLRGRLQILATAESIDRLFEIDLVGDGRTFDVAVYRSDRSFVLEVEPSESGRLRDLVSYVRPMVARMRQSRSLQELCQSGARHLRALTGFDRVKVYRFDQNKSGQVVAEWRAPGVDSYMGLHFPATDIPAQARALYTKNMLRIIVDVDDQTTTILPATDPNGQPLDLTMSGIRAVSPIHIEYLRNMGVKASMSVSIMKRGELWGLFACHHHKPLRLPYSVRTAAELFGEFFSYILEQSEGDAALARQSRARLLHDEIMARVARGNSLGDTLNDFAATIAEVIPYDGMAAWIDGEYRTVGIAPTREEFEPLSRFLNTAASSAIWATDKLSTAFPPAAAYVDRCSGLLALPVSRVPRDYIVLFRREHVHEVNWAGNPDKPAEIVEGDSRIHPRKSFELWKQERRGYSRPWEEDEIAIAQSLRVTLLEVVLQLADAAHRDRAQAHKRQEFLIAELNHRVRNILNLVRGLVSQSASGSESIEDFAEIVGKRIYALARAHDQVTQANWSPASLYTLIRTECRAYAEGEEERVFMRGPDAMLTPAAFTSLALVIHELMTNSSKYGALSDPRGRVEIAMSRDAEDGLNISWTEVDGPPVAPPRRSGFGSTIIAHTVPHELGGTASVDFRPEGLVAHFSLPASAIAGFAHPQIAPPTASVTPLRPKGTVDGQPLGHAMVVEDNVVIALEAEQLLLDLGFAAVHVCGSTGDALAALDRGEVAFALLDVHLGEGETSEPIARALSSRRIPYAIVSGLGERSAIADGFAGAPLVTKPYLRSDIERLLASLGMR
ncbi:HWE histidine kinase domain-containing protein [Rhizorhabdus phycosphaerae]|uniref:HWE histidine kinase domain-containing protein n=1 Tax=Rhizorhabdus phycosphaerae TaxID=2711156 RepID=UPI0013EE0DFB|nr:HWE histidine kinase domain-containing protein [Rhizorhabdus phycosphaerae]